MTVWCCCRGHRDQPDTPDCIHYCNPGVPQNWISQLSLAIALQVKPLTGQVPDSRCLWGTEPVIDPAEASYGS